MRSIFASTSLDSVIEVFSFILPLYHQTEFQRQLHQSLAAEVSRSGRGHINLLNIAHNFGIS
jgi:hypothetical protein